MYDSSKMLIDKMPMSANMIWEMMDRVPEMEVNDVN
jgi:hypothetical protein